MAGAKQEAEDVAEPVPYVARQRATLCASHCHNLSRRCIGKANEVFEYDFERARGDIAGRGGERIGQVLGREEEVEEEEEAVCRRETGEDSQRRMISEIVFERVSVQHYFNTVCICIYEPLRFEGRGEGIQYAHLGNLQREK